MIPFLVAPRGSILAGCDIFYDHVNPVTRQTIDQLASGKLRDLNTEESWELLEDLALYDNESWNDPRDFTKPVKAITLPQDVPMVPTTLSIAWKIPNKPLLNTHSRVPMKREIHNAQPISTAQSTPSQSTLSNQKDPKTEDDGEVVFIEIIRDDDEPQNENPTEGEGTTTEGPAVEYFDTLPTRDELTYHKYLMCGPIPLIVLRNPIIIEGCPSNLKIPCNIGHVHIEKAYIDPNSPLNIMTRMMYNWIMRRKLDPRKSSNRGVSNFTGRIKRMHVFIGNFTYVIDFMIVDDISSIIDPRLSQVVLGRPFIEISNMTHDPPEGVVRFTNKNDEVAYRIPHKIEQYNSFSNLEKEHTKLVYLRNEEGKRRGVEYVMSKILGFYKECLELGPEYATGMEDEGEEAVTHVMRRSWVAVMEIMPIDQVLFDQLSSSHVHKAFDGAFKEKARGFDKAFYGEKAGGFDRAFYGAFYGAFEEKAGGFEEKAGGFEEKVRERKRKIHPLGEYIITLYTNGKLRTRATVTLVSRAE
ncbi:retrotransposon ORF1, partial [Tanacetum coccineum]